MPLPKYGPPGTPEYRAYQKEWRRLWRLDPEIRKKHSQKTQDWIKKNPEKHTIGLYKRAAKYRGIEHTLTEMEMLRLIKLQCSYCGAQPNPLNGIDRIDNSRGYVEGNVITACSTCNYAKRDMTLEEFKAWILRVATTIGGGGNG